MGLEYCELFLVGQHSRGKLGVRVVTLGSLVLAIKQVLVRPFEIERIGQRLARVAILELGPTEVEDEGTETGGLRMRDFV